MSRKHVSTQRDANEPAIVAALEQIPGVTVERLDRPADLLAGCLTPCVKCGHWERRTFLLEVKEPIGPRGGASGHSRGPSDPQRRFIARWRGHFATVRTPQEALEAVGKGAR